MVGSTFRSLPQALELSPGLLLILLCVWSVPSSAITYIDTSPVGPEFPEWDGGDTELCFADIDLDGDVDFLSIGDHGSPYINTDQHGIMVYFGNGAGGWSINMAGNFGYGGIAVGDVNGDGHLDVGYGMHHDYSSNDFGDQLIEVALGDGTGLSWAPWDDGLATNGEDWGMFATDFADFDNDGDLDLASNSFGSGNGVHVYRNNGDGTWTQTFARSGGNARAHLCCADVNGDGFADIAASYQYGTIFLGDGSGSFTSGDSGLPSGGSLGLDGVSLGDVDGDGCADLSFVQSGGVHVYVWRDDHWENSSSGLPASGIYGISQLADMDADGHLDVIALGDGTLSVWVGDGSGLWTAAGSQVVAPAVDSAALSTGGDVDHNGRYDIALVQEEGSWPSYQNYLYVLRESSPATARFALPVFPRQGELFHGGSIQVIRWLAAQIGGDEATITLEVSVSGPQGPWTSIATGLPDSGHHQWIVPHAYSDQAHLRVTLSQSGEEVSASSGPFSIRPGESAAVDSPLDNEEISFPGGGLRQEGHLRPHPNPTTGPLRVSWRGPTRSSGANDSEPAGYLQLHDAAGRVLARWPLGRELDLRTMVSRHGGGAGVYTLRLVSGSHRCEPERIVLFR